MMNIDEFKQLLKTKLPEPILYFDEPLKNYTTFKIGGTADILVKPNTLQQVTETVALCKEQGVPYYILGNGSNLLVADTGYRGVIIQIYNRLSDIKVEGNTITAMAGALLSKVAAVALKEGLEGFEFAQGIPGTIGGAIVMNAGAYDGEMKQVVVKCEVIDDKGKILTLQNKALEFGYRSSVIEKKGYIVLSVTLELTPGDPVAIKEKMKDFASRRKEKQPLDKPSAGSTFKRPEGHFAGKLIMDSGLRGYQIGGAKVSEKHCGFIVNEGNATCQDIEDLIAYVQKVVFEKYQVQLEPEVKKLF